MVVMIVNRAVMRANAEHVKRVIQRRISAKVPVRQAKNVVMAYVKVSVNAIQNIKTATNVRI